MGQKPTPTALKLVTGNPGKRPLNKNEPKPRFGIGRAPEWLSETQREIWEEAVKNSPAGLLTGVDRKIFLTWVVSASAHQDAALLCNERGYTITTLNGNEIQAPWVGVMNKQAQILIKTSSELGFTPAARSRVSVHNDDDEAETDPAAEFFN